MKKGNILDIGMEAVRRSGFTNMNIQSSVQYYASKLGFSELVIWLEETEGRDYMWYLDTLNPDFIPSLSKEEIEDIIEADYDFEAREIICEQYETEILEYKNKPGFIELKQLPFDYEEFNQEKVSLMKAIESKVDDHPFNYILPMSDGSVIVWLQDYFYEYKDKGKGKGVELFPLTGEEWAHKQYSLIRLSEEAKMKFQTVDEHMRLAALLASK